MRIQKLKYDINKITPEWFVQDDVLRLSIHYWKRNETTDGHSGCSANWMYKMEDGDFITAYNKIVKSAKESFDLPYLKKIKVDKEDEPIGSVKSSGLDMLSIMIGICIGAFVVAFFF